MLSDDGGIDAGTLFGIIAAIGMAVFLILVLAWVLGVFKSWGF